MKPLVKMRWDAKFFWGCAVLLIFIAGCRQVRYRFVALSLPSSPVPPPVTSYTPTFDRGTVVRTLKKKYKDLTWKQLSTALKLDKKHPTGISFKPSQARYYDRVVKKLKLSAAEKATLDKLGFVKVDHHQRYSMGALYYSIYTSDLPVLITTDSILHAIHRSYDATLKELEQTLLLWQINEVLGKTHVLTALAHSKHPKLRPVLKDIDFTLTVARNLFAGKWTPAIPSKLGNNTRVTKMLTKVKALKLETPGNGSGTLLFGARRFIDFSQFRPRGHYTESHLLKRYFRGLMWLGRADLGFYLEPKPKQSDPYQQLRGAAVLVTLMQQAGVIPVLHSMDQVIQFMVGKSDNLTVFALLKNLRKAGLTGLAQLTGKKPMITLLKALAASQVGRPKIRSQVLVVRIDNATTAPIPKHFQVFGQRFVVDSYVLSNMVFDSVIFKKRKQLRMMPKGLDVMAALGNNHAVSLLKPEIQKWHYGGNLLSMRGVMERYPAQWWQQNLYNIWLQSLRELFVPPQSKHLPQVMRTQAWQHKMLETQLASWAELRHDTILYAKQSYTGYPLCVYPTGYVEPYPKFYRTLEIFAHEASRRIANIKVSPDTPRERKWFQSIKRRQSAFYKRAANILAQLRILSQKELKAQPFTSKEKAFIKQTLDIRGGGSGPPRYDGWYPKLIYGGSPAKWNPTAADVHTDPRSQRVLQVAVGNAQFLIAAIDNNDDKMIFVGPAYSYYEFKHPASNRLTDSKWQEILMKNPPKRPAWTKAYTVRGTRRHPAR